MPRQDIGGKKDTAQHRMYIGGKWVNAASGDVLPSLDPYRGETWAEVPDGGPEDVNRAVDAARTAVQEGPWSRMTGIDRGRLIRELARLLSERGENVAHAEVRDNGKLLREMAAQVDALPDWYYYFAGAADKILGAVLPSAKSNYFVYTLREPIGVVGAITPWNSPTLILAYKLAPALAAGCTFVLKPSEHAPVSALKFAEIVEEAGFPPGVFNVVTGRGRAAGQPLAEHPGVDKLSFTGSSQSGMLVARAASNHLGRVSLELGGKSPNIVFADADLGAATNGILAGIFAAAGQSCVAGSRLLLQRSVHDEVVERVVGRARRIRLGDPMLPETEMGPLAFPTQFERVRSYIHAGEEEGATLVTGGRQPPKEGGLFIEPTVFTNVKNQMKIAQEEIFGPVLCVTPFEDEREAVAIANESRYGLAAGVWTRDIRLAHRMAAALEVGTVWINAYRIVNYDVPFGGLKMSGYGLDNGLDSIHEYLRQKSVWIEVQNEARDPFRLG